MQKQTLISNKAEYRAALHVVNATSSPSLAGIYGGAVVLAGFWRPATRELFHRVGQRPATRTFFHQVRKMASVTKQDTAHEATRLMLRSSLKLIKAARRVREDLRGLLGRL